jgi:hypothetical protein
MSNVAVAVGLAVLLVTAASQTGGLGDHDFVLVAMGGLAAAVFCTIVALESHSRRAAVAALASILPFGLLVYFLVTSDG